MAKRCFSKVEEISSSVKTAFLPGSNSSCNSIIPDGMPGFLPHSSTVRPKYPVFRTFLQSKVFSPRISAMFSHLFSLNTSMCTGADNSSKSEEPHPYGLVSKVNKKFLVKLRIRGAHHMRRAKALVTEMNSGKHGMI
ncbi:hypothetical protein AGDE_02546 [Angomonas deanei]|nr:hypothetical protein AGDE_02546 [Angomonas deanei]|eukprot:EPY41378.1 hypothetical protein AGDE_02546 [Angomonas deanei]